MGCSMKHKKPNRTALALNRLLLGTILAALLGGCIQIDRVEQESVSPAATARDTFPASSSSSSSPAAPRPGSSVEPPESPSQTNATARPREHRNETPPQPQPTQKPVWGPVTAPVHPGVTVSTGVGACTTNFLFTSLDNRHIYIGTAAHCFAESGPCSGDYDGLPVGSPVQFLSDNYTQLDFANVSYVMGVNGTLAYSSELTMREVGEVDHSTCVYNDFALIEIPLQQQSKVTPYVPGFGFPTRIAEPTDIGLGERAMCYCGSSVWQNQDPLIQKQGIVSQEPKSENDGWWYLALYQTPIFWGDSGSLGMVGDNEAAGSLAYFGFNFDDNNPVNGSPGPGNAGYTVLAKALDYMEKHAGLKVKLAEP